MKELTEIRAELDGVDRQIVALFEQRMQLCREVAEYKIAAHKPVLDHSREEQVLASRAALAQDPSLREPVRALFTELMRLSREEQSRLVKEAEQGC